MKTPVSHISIDELSFSVFFTESRCVISLPTEADAEFVVKQAVSSATPVVRLYVPKES